MNDTDTKRFVISALQLAAESWDALARDTVVPDFAAQADRARELAKTLQSELDRESSPN